MALLDPDVFQHFLVTPSLLFRVNRRQLGKGKWPQEASWVGCPSGACLPQRLPPPLGPQIGGWPLLYAAICPRAPTPELWAETFSFLGVLALSSAALVSSVLIL